MTCRQRKLKCSEERPTCAQCAKANRRCVPASGITFRHQQNPSMNGNQESLKSFYGYKETFAKAAQWVPVSKELTWIHTSNPYDDIEDSDREQQRARESVSNNPSRGLAGNELSQADYSAFTEGLAALSAVASQDQYNLAIPLAPMEQRQMQDPQSDSSSRQLDFVLDSAAKMPNTDHQLDPQLQMPQVAAAHSPSYIRARSPTIHRDAHP